MDLARERPPHWPRLSNTLPILVLRFLPNPNKRTIHKLRRCFVWNNRYFELDTFVEPQLPHLLLEIEDVSEEEVLEFPPFLKVVKEVTNDPNYYNANLAK